MYGSDICKLYCACFILFVKRWHYFRQQELAYNYAGEVYLGKGVRVTMVTAQLATQVVGGAKSAWVRASGCLVRTHVRTTCCLVFVSVFLILARSFSMCE